MKTLTLVLYAYVSFFTLNTFAQSNEMVKLKVEFPKAQFEGMGHCRSPNLERPRGGKPRPPIFIPKGAGQILSADCRVTSSNNQPLSGELSYITDGNKGDYNETRVDIGKGLQWVQIDLGSEKEIWAVCIWHAFAKYGIYKDMVCQVSNDPDFFEGVSTVFNNDHDNSSKLGKGKDKEYYESNKSRPIPVKGVKGRYMRFYSAGNRRDDLNCYTEIEIYGR